MNSTTYISQFVTDRVLTIIHNQWEWFLPVQHRHVQFRIRLTGKNGSPNVLGFSIFFHIYWHPLRDIDPFLSKINSTLWTYSRTVYILLNVGFPVFRYSYYLTNNGIFESLDLLRREKFIEDCHHAPFSSQFCIYFGSTLF